MKTEYTINELIFEVTKFYNGTLDPVKALKLFQLEFGFKPKIRISDSDIWFNDFILEKYKPEFVTKEHLVFMKELQESGVVNMFMSRPYIINRFDCSDLEAKEIFSFYAKHYNEIYKLPEDFL